MDKVLNKIKKIIDNEKFDDSKFLIDTDEKLLDDQLFLEYNCKILNKMLVKLGEKLVKGGWRYNKISWEVVKSW